MNKLKSKFGMSNRNVVIGLIILVGISIFFACNKNEKLEIENKVGVDYPISKNSINLIDNVYFISFPNNSSNMEIPRRIGIGFHAGAYYIPKNIKGYDKYVKMIEENEGEILKVTLGDFTKKGTPIIKVEIPDFQEKEKALIRIKESKELPKNLETKSSKSSSNMSLSRATQFFNQFENLNCSSYNGNICIPFQYARDGCYARAHYMRKLIEDAGYSCKKIFACAMNSTPLSANTKANCCVYWYYHVAPLVSVNTGNTTTQMVIDPSLFNSPVSKTTWKNKMEENCGGFGIPNISIRIKPSATYGYSIYNDNYSYDNNYSNTYYTLNLYSNLSGCE